MTYATLPSKAVPDYSAPWDLPYTTSTPKRSRRFSSLEGLGPLQKADYCWLGYSSASVSGPPFVTVARVMGHTCSHFVFGPLLFFHAATGSALSYGLECLML